MQRRLRACVSICFAGHDDMQRCGVRMNETSPPPTPPTPAAVEWHLVGLDVRLHVVLEALEALGAVRCQHPQLGGKGFRVPQVPRPDAIPGRLHPAPPPPIAARGRLAAAALLQGPQGGGGRGGAFTWPR